MNQQTIKQRLTNTIVFRQYVHMIKNQPTEIVQQFYENLKKDGLDTVKGKELEALIKQRLNLA